ncbi:flagellar motor switch phosphatase FliY [Virgibacillus sediminis]|uniref:Flagellar motor switch phosphatase FliY n=1 Tax=Virgibacillus sediminis TaxID=202260 RepID=A0ABV7AB71_9BACI
MMNDGMLSQDEIDALLSMDEGSGSSSGDQEGSQLLSDIEKDAIGEIGNISFGSSATTLSTLLNQKVEITTPQVTVVQQDLEESLAYESISIEVKYTEGFTGRNVFVLKKEDVAVISDIMLGGDGTSAVTELTDIHLSAVQEAMNQMMGSAATSMSTIFGKRVDISPPLIKQEDDGMKESLGNQGYVQVFFNLQVGELIDSNMVQVIPLEFAKQMADHLLNGHGEVEQAAGSESDSSYAYDSLQREEKHPPNASQDQEENEQTTPQVLGETFDKKKSTVQEADFSSFEQVELNKKEQRNLDMLLDIPLKVTVELGRTKQSIRNILELSSGSIIELDKLAGEPVDILVNEKLIAKGEVVVIDENFGVRVSDIVSPSDRLKKLK